MSPDTFSRPHVASFIKSVTRQCLQQYSNRRFTRVRGLDVCRSCISPHHKLCHSAEAILRDPSHVLRPGVHERYEPIMNGRYDESQEGLWLMFTSNPMQKKKIVRSWARRRLTQAVLEQLRIRGFDGEGRKIALGATGEEASPKSSLGETSGEGVPEALVGTVDIEVVNQIVEVEYKEVQRQAGLLVQEVLKICGRPQLQNKPSVSRKVSYR